MLGREVQNMIDQALQQGNRSREQALRQADRQRELAQRQIEQEQRQIERQRELAQRALEQEQRQVQRQRELAQRALEQEQRQVQRQRELTQRTLEQEQRQAERRKEAAQRALEQAQRQAERREELAQRNRDNEHFNFDHKQDEVKKPLDAKFNEDELHFIQQAIEASRRDEVLEKERSPERKVSEEEQLQYEIAIAESLREEKERHNPSSYHQIVAKLQKETSDKKNEIKIENAADNTYSEMTQDYLDSLQKKNPSLSNMVEELKLTELEEEKLSKFQDPIHFTIATTPVRFNGKLFNLQTLLDCLGKKDPLSNKYTVSKSQIQPDWETAGELAQALKAIKEARNNENATPIISNDHNAEAKPTENQEDQKIDEESHSGIFNWVTRFLR